MKIETTAKLNNLRMSPRKIRLVIDLIRGMKAQKALTQLTFSKKHAARPVLKLLQSAIANAKHNHEMDEENLKISRVFVDGGSILYRWMPRAMGRATPIRKRTSHITLVLEGESAKTVNKEKKAEKKPIKK